MPCQLTQFNRRPYTKLLSTLRKQELIWLCVELRLSTDGSVVDLKERLKVYLDDNHNEFAANPGYKVLYPNQRRRRHPRPPASHTLSSSPTLSFRSWNGIADEPQQQPNPHEHSPSPQFSPAPSHQQLHYLHEPPEPEFVIPPQSNSGWNHSPPAFPPLNNAGSKFSTPKFISVHDIPPLSYSSLKTLPSFPL